MAAARKTLQRRTIQGVFQNAVRPLTPHEAWRAAGEALPALGIATVYRTIRTMLASGDLRRVEIPGQPPRYELSTREPHHHFVCSGCSEIFPLPGVSVDLDGLVPEGFRVEGHEVMLFGYCPRCSDGAG